MAGWTASQFLLPAIARAVVHSAGGRGDFSFGVDVSLLLAAAFVFALAEIWRSGVRIQDDVEATV